MKGIFLTLICAIALTSASNDSEEIALNNQGCPIDITIEYLLPHEFCNQFYQCVIGTPIPMECPPPTAFNLNTNKCDWIENVDCGDRTFPVEENKTEKEVPTTTRPLFGYDDPSKAPEICAQENSDDKLISHEDCNKYYQCVWGGTIVRECPTNLYYNPKNGQCDWQANVVCNNPGVINPDWSYAEKACSKGASLVPHDKYCDSFYQCGPQGPIEQPCWPGLVFDSKIQGCNWPQYVNCGDKGYRPPVTTTEVVQPEVTKPTVIQTEGTSKPEEIKPEVTNAPEVIQPETALPEVTNEPEVIQPGTAVPETTVDDVLVEEPSAES